MGTKFERKGAEKVGFTLIVFAILTVLFVLSCDSEESKQQPVLVTIQVNDADVTSTTATLKGEITILGNYNIIEYGIQISSSMVFSSYTDKKVSSAPAQGQFSVDITGLNPGTTYYYRAYAIVNTAHVYAPDPLHFTTKSPTR